MVEQNPALVLVVDDNEMNRDMLLRRLQRQGYEVVVAENGVRALELMQEYAFDLILLDIMMPQLNGYEVLERIKSDQNLHDIPVIMISAVDDLDSVVKCIEMGAEDYLFKPFNPVLLKARVTACLEKRRFRVQSGTGANPRLLTALQETIIGIGQDVDALLSQETTDGQRQYLERIHADLVRALEMLSGS